MKHLLAFLLALPLSAAAQPVSPAPTPPAMQSALLDGSGNLMITNTDGSSGIIALGSTFQTIANALTIGVVNTAISNGFTNYGFGTAAKNNTSDFAKASDLATEITNRNTAGYLTSVAGLTNNPTLAQIVSALSSSFVTPTQLSASSLSGGGPYTVSTLPSCNYAMAGKYSYVTDLGGGPSNAVCKNATSTKSGNWAPTGNPIPDITATCGNITISPLVTSPIQKLTCTNFPAGSAINVINAAQNPGYQFTIITPSSLGSLLSTLGLNVGGASSGLPGVAAGTKTAFSIASDGSLVQTQ